MKPKELLSEITPLTSENCFILINRTKNSFTFPLHIHGEYELNFIQGAKGAQRIVGDSMEEIEDLDLTLITNSQLGHGWVDHHCETGDIREVTIQFHPSLLSDDLLNRTQFHSIAQLFKSARKGVAFSRRTIENVLPRINRLCELGGFYSVVELFTILYELSLATNIKILSSSSFLDNDASNESRRIMKVVNFLYGNYSRDISLSEASDLVSMVEVAFCRFFKKHTGRSFVEYLTDIRIGMATKQLIESNKTITEICYECGFNNISNFNRCFRKKKGCTPSEFRTQYAKARQII